MKKNHTLLLLLFILGITNAQIINIPDANFKAKLIANGVDTNTDGEIQQSEALSVTGLYLDSANISSLEGIQSFSNATLLRCSDNPLTEINLCGTAVTNLTCYNCPNLTTVILRNNFISEYFWTEPPLAPLIVGNLPSVQYVCADSAEMWIAQLAFNSSTTNTVTYSSDCDLSNCIFALNTAFPAQNFTVGVYPNPAKSQLNLSFIESATLKSASIYNALGQLVLTKVNPNQTIDVSSLSSGSYFITITSDKGTATGKFIKE